MIEAVWLVGIGFTTGLISGIVLENLARRSFEEKKDGDSDL